MASVIKKQCLNCNKVINVRIADHKRGWGKFCSKSCKAKDQERRTGQNASYYDRKQYDKYERWHEESLDAVEHGWDGHKNVF